VIVQISNPTPVSVRDVNVLIRYPDSQGRALQVVKEIRGTIPPGKSVLIEAGIGPIQDPQFLRYMKFRVTKADVIK